MDHISNAFSLLELDVEDDRKETTSSADNTEKANGIFDFTSTLCLHTPYDFRKSSSVYNLVKLFVELGVHKNYSHLLVLCIR